MPDPLRRLSRGLSRRQFLGIGTAGLALYAGGEGFDIGREMVLQQRAWLSAKASNTVFLREHGDAFRGVAIGASFAPEQWRAEDRAGPEPLAAVDWAVRELGMRQMRVGLRWSLVEAERGVVALAAYRPYLDYAFERGLELCLNLGPIRTFRWPEEHLPAWVARAIDIPADKARVSSKSALAVVATDYLARLLDALAGDYGRERLRSVAVLQTENEPFYPLRTHHWVLEGEYVRSTIELARPYFPDSRILVTTAGRLNFGPVKDLFGSLLGESGTYEGRLVMGFDYHYKTPLRDSFPAIRYTDPITFQRVGYETCEENREAAREMGYGIEVTEAQAEPFGRLTEPGNSARHFRFMLLRCAERVLLPDQPSVIRVWGIEEMAKKALRGETTDEHEAIFELIRRLNAV